MILVVGLGNVGLNYTNTYHNVGFMAADFLCEKLGGKFSKRGLKSCYAECYYNGEKIIIAKPETYMNLSGECVVMFKNKFKIPNENIYVLCDDIDLPLAKVRLRHKGSAGSHNGLKNIQLFIGEDYNRIRIGISRDEQFADLADFVLSKIPENNLTELKQAVKEAVDILLCDLER